MGPALLVLCFSCFSLPWRSVTTTGSSAADLTTNWRRLVRTPLLRRQRKYCRSCGTKLVSTPVQLIRLGRSSFNVPLLWTSPERGEGFLTSRIEVRPYFVPFRAFFYLITSEKLTWVQKVPKKKGGGLNEHFPFRKKRESGPSDPNMMGDPSGATPSYLESEYKFLASFMSLSENERRSIGHDFDSLIKSCTFRGKDCLNIRSAFNWTFSFSFIERKLLSYFEMESSPRFGNCFSFNSNVSGNSTTTWSSSLPGQEGKKNAGIDKLSASSQLKQEMFSVFALYIHHHQLNLARLFWAPCGQIWACEDTFW